MHQNIGQFKISMNNFYVTDRFKAKQDLDHEVSGFIFFESAS